MTSDYRYERKFFIADLNPHEVEAIVKLHPAMFREIFPPRIVNNIYFDSLSMSNYMDNVDGDAQRTKIRIRWYGDEHNTIRRPVLEFKIKNGLLGKKESYPLSPLEINGSAGHPEFMESIQKAGIPEHIRLKLTTLKPSLTNRYHRKYFQSTDGKYRVTIDTDQHFQRVDHYYNSIATAADSYSVILELKYAAEADDQANQITNYFAFRITKSSKYVNGINKLLGCL